MIKVDGKARRITLDSGAVATAIDAYLVANGVHVSGARTIRSESGELVAQHIVIVDPSGRCHVNGRPELVEVRP